MKQGWDGNDIDFIPPLRVPQSSYGVEAQRTHTMSIFFQTLLGKD